MAQSLEKVLNVFGLTFCVIALNTDFQTKLNCEDANATIAATAIRLDNAVWKAV